jgi:putative membrane protein
MESGVRAIGTQACIWETQSDLGDALLGAIVTLILLRRCHDKQLNQLLSQN